MYMKCTNCGARYPHNMEHVCRSEKSPAKPAPSHEPVDPAPSRAVASDGLTPQQRWRQKNIDHVRAKQREYQKAYRARKRAEK